MGIDIYAKWRKQTEAEEQAQYTGFKVNAGGVGYLREAYHGGPYATKYLVQEAFDAEEHEAPISAHILRERLPLPLTVILSLYREQKVYGGGKDPSRVDAEELEKQGISLEDFIKKQMEAGLEDVEHELIAKAIPRSAIEATEKLIENRTLPPFALSYVEFVELCEKKEAETGEPCTILASY